MLLASWQYYLVMLYYKTTRPLRKMLKPGISTLRSAINLFTPFNNPPSEANQDYEVIDGVKTMVTNWSNQEPELIVLFIHGGGFSLCSTKTHANIMAHLAKYSGARVYGPEYGLAPEHKFPTALNQCFSVYEELKIRYPDLPIFIGGDSAGGNLAASICIRLAEEKKEKPRGIFLLSPWLDLRDDSSSKKANSKGESVFDGDDLRDYALNYCDEEKWREPLVSPVLADPIVFPPILIQATENEYLYQDAVEFTKKIEESGGEITSQFYKKLFHAWQVFPSFVPEAKDALQKVGKFLKSTANKG